MQNNKYLPPSPMQIFKSILTKILVVLMFLYFVFGVFLFFNQKELIYFPDTQDFKKCPGFSDYEKITYHGTRFYFKQGTTNKLIVYYHGNAGSACDRATFKNVFESSGASLMFVEYAGYSSSSIFPSQKILLRDVEHIYNYIDEASYNEVLVYGQSIGSGAASYHAYLGGVDSLILVTPFSRLRDVVQSNFLIYPATLLLTEKYDNIYWLQNYTGALTIFHGDSDLVIPSKFSQKLFNHLPTKNKEFVMIEGKGHNNIWSSSVFINKLTACLNRQ